MLRVTKIAMKIVDGWTGKDLNKEVIIKAGLVHDLANIVRFKLVDGSPLIIRQKETIEKYGADDHEATQKMLRELGLADEIIEIVQGKSFSNAIEVEQSHNWPLKILFYADMRVVPSGVVDLETRLTDIVTRIDKYRDHPQKEQLMASARKVEQQLQIMTTTQLGDITDESISEGLEDLLETEI